MAICVILRILAGSALFANTENPYELFSIGCQLELSGKLSEAISYYQKAKVLAPESPEIYMALSQALYQLGDFDDGIATALEGLARFPQRIELYRDIAAGYVGKQDLKNAIQYYEKARAIEPDAVDIYESLSILYDITGKTEQAIQSLDAIPDSMKSSDTYVRLGTLQGKLKKHEEAIRYYHQAYGLDSTNMTALVAIGTGFDMLNVKDSTIYYYEKAVREDSLLNTVGKRLIDLYSDTEQYEKMVRLTQRVLNIDYSDGYARRSLGYALYKTNMIEDALIQFLIAAKIDPQDAYSRFYIGRIYLERGSYDDAQREIEEAISIDPDFVELWIYMGFIAINREDFSAAQYAFEEAAYRGGDHAQIHYLLGLVSEMQQRLHDAYFHYRKSLDIQPTNVLYLEAFANLCERVNKKDEALKTFQKILMLDTTNAVALNYVGYTYAERNDSLEYALALIDRALAIDANNGYYIDSRGWVLYQMGNYEEALLELKRASELVQDAVVFEHLGDVYMKLHEVEKAKAVYKSALQYDPTNKKIMHKLRSLEE